ncbi:Zinc finger, C2H2-like protein [Corchorus olitorius]|uniref:Zinc finger, C2H2-like protein n=1 Tax=Corchorus olitorius TaxID=93759 RepID=A0A1R3JTE5_9ROSI|nr:Zinc finger, C2H2-like protein [Corchorus olitorius]
MDNKKQTRVCKICNRRFANGKAMGGHMRSHLAKLPLPPKPIDKSPSPYSSLTYPSSEVNNHRSTEDIESAAKNPTGRRSKRPRKLPLVVGSPSDSVSSVVLPEDDENSLSSEDAARCLIMLSRDSWTRKKEKKESYNFDDDQFIIDGYEEDFVGAEEMNEDGYYLKQEEEDDEDDDESFCVTNYHSAKAHAKYKCETCNKIFKSHQALGGHRASHKNKPMILNEGGGGDGGDGGGGGDNNQIIHQQRIFKCPFCDKVFQSGQALGGHKKVHFTYLAVPEKVSNEFETSSSSSAVQSFDLNLPAPEYHDGGGDEY